jgi:hypothetical protein
MYAQIIDKLPDMEIIYTYLGGNVYRTLCEDFVAKSYDIEVLIKGEV